ncbi:aminotransferase class I/II-fold pyridoxal phosphate-dependent enzyme [Wenzhouxiangella marina]|uniref:alanine transaminase n=1 Tax=Wenzhouxiangella marina TaxID=1579979 RepID=A0A0K0XUF2_9GAMM|nr:aminotransferase class I/II-fold pyridoxal phosphate-dependent enzyme [Wenzhouxiangella marina]AKS41344.1 Aminotransferase [Wenzhouxiangella marina]MBB6086906.1 alanine-synthesizing transaminase [Wenzhouxiangella marina]
MKPNFQTASRVRDVRYEIRGALARRARELEQQGNDILQLNIGNPGAFGLRTPETMRRAVVRNLKYSEAYGPQTGIFPAREAVAMQFQGRGMTETTYDQVIVGNGVSELVDLVLRSLLEPGDEVLVPAPDYPLWTAAVVLNGGKAVHYRCQAEQDFIPDVEQIRARITDRTRALVVINPNNPTGAVYPESVLQALADLAAEHDLILFSDEIYDAICFDDARFVPMAPLAENTLCVSFGGLSKVYRACGWRVGWAVFTGQLERAQDYRLAVEKLSALRLSANVPGQWAVQTALGGYQSIADLVARGGRLYESRQAVIDAVERSRFLELVTPMGAMYAFPSVRADHFPDFDDHRFAAELLEQKHILIVPGSSFNIPERNHFRITLLPEAEDLERAFEKINDLLEELADEPERVQQRP